MFNVELKITKILKSGWRRWEKSGLPWELNIYSHRCVPCRTTSLPSFNSFLPQIERDSSVYVLDVIFG